MKQLLDPISKLMQMENQDKLNNINTRKDFLHNFQSFVESSKENTNFIDRFRLKKIKSDIETKNNILLEEYRFTQSIVNENNYQKKIYLNTSEFNKENFDNRNYYTNLNLRNIFNKNASPKNFIVCNKNSKNTKNLKLYEDIKKPDIVNDFFESINIISTNTKTNSTKSIAVNTYNDYCDKNTNTYSNIEFTIERVAETTLKETVKDIFKNDALIEDKKDILPKIYMNNTNHIIYIKENDINNQENDEKNKENDEKNKENDDIDKENDDKNKENDDIDKENDDKNKNNLFIIKSTFSNRRKRSKKFVLNSDIVNYLDNDATNKSTKNENTKEADNSKRCTKIISKEPKIIEKKELLPNNVKPIKLNLNNFIDVNKIKTSSNNSKTVLNNENKEKDKNLEEKNILFKSTNKLIEIVLSEK